MLEEWVPATIDALPALMEAVDGKMEVLIDGGIRRGTDVFKVVVSLMVYGRG